jgi:hypothetical protein
MAVNAFPGREGRMKRQDTSLAVDAIPSGMLQISMLKGWTGMALHQWLGEVMGVVAF